MSDLLKELLETTQYQQDGEEFTDITETDETDDEDEDEVVQNEEIVDNFNPYHDERGRFTTSPAHGGSPAVTTFHPKYNPEPTGVFVGPARPAEPPKPAFSGKYADLSKQEKMHLSELYQKIRAGVMNITPAELATYNKLNPRGKQSAGLDKYADQIKAMSRTGSNLDHLVFWRGAEGMGRFASETLKDEFMSLRTRFPGFKLASDSRPCKFQVSNKEYVDIEGRPQGSSIGSFRYNSFFPKDNMITIAGTHRYINREWGPRLSEGRPSFTCDPSMRGTITHESGHFFHLGGGLQSVAVEKGYSPFHYSVMWESIARSIPKNAVSKYGSTNDHELFAESFSAYTHPGYRGDLPKPIHDFMKEVLGA